jgi:hypothetical protein
MTAMYEGLKIFTLAGLEHEFICSADGLDDHFATPPEQPLYLIYSLGANAFFS